uniref:von Willebrand factor A domain containing 5B1 n=1 Tax=Callorhinchus milii TaxID=7868 RepID=A0A4W3H325_CALMI
MPGLINQNNGSNLPLTSSEVTSCMMGYTLGISASLTYANPEDHPIEGLFIYPLGEHTAVVGFEAFVSGQQPATCMCTAAFTPGRPLGALTGSFWPLATGHLTLDEDLERTMFVVSLGVIPALEIVSVVLSTSSELQTLPSGAVRVLLSSVYTPRVLQPDPVVQSSAENQFRSGNRLCLARCLDEEVTNPSVYEFSFQLEIRGPCLLAGVESPTHSIRVDADPKAFCASSVVVTLAKKHTCDRPVEIVIHPSEPHLPHILMEGGDMSPDEYEQHLKGKSDFIKGSKKDPSSEKKVTSDLIQKRLNKDIPHNPVVMLNFCPNLKISWIVSLTLTDDLQFPFFLAAEKDAMIVVLKSLVPSCLFNIIGFGSTFRTLFPASRPYNEDTLALACEHVKKMRADMGGTNISAPLSWILRQPAYRGHPLLLFLLTDGAVNNTGKVIESVRAHAHSTRCFSFGIGQNACRRLVLGLASVSKGAAEFLGDGERLQPKMVTSLKKAMMPVLSDVTIEWLFPETTEVLLSPVGPSTLFPGDRLVGYSVICDTSRYHSNPRSVSIRHEETRLTRAREPGNNPSNLLHPPDNNFFVRLLSSYPTGSEQQAVTVRKLEVGLTVCKALHVPLIVQLRLRHCQALRDTTWGDGRTINPDPQNRPRSLPVAPPAVLALNVRKLHWAEISQQPPPSVLSPPTPPTSPSNFELRLCKWQLTWARKYHVFSPTLKAKSPQGVRDSGPHHSKPDCKAVISGLLSGEVLRWEVTFDLGSLLDHGKVQGGFQEDPWNETVHHLAAKSVIRDFEQMAEKECEIEHALWLLTLKRSRTLSCAKGCCSPAVALDSNCKRRVLSTEMVGRDKVLKPLCDVGFNGTHLSQLISTEQTSRVAVCHRLCSSHSALEENNCTSGHCASASCCCCCHCLSQITLQLASGAFLLDEPFCEAVSIPMEKLRWSSPFPSHRATASPTPSPPSVAGRRTSSPRKPQASSPSQADSGRGSETDCSEALCLPSGGNGGTDPGGTLWATAVALAWLEHSSATSFIEWELVAAKASTWLNSQPIPEGRDLPTIKASARQLFVLLRHWDENLQLNVLCYNPNSV